MKDHVALTNCFYCGEGSTILLATTYRGNEPVHDMKPFHNKVLDMEPCSKCKGYMKQGIILITIDEKKSEKDWNQDPNHGKCPECNGYHRFPKCRKCGGTGRSFFMPNPYRSGGWFVVTEDAMKRMLSNAKDKDMLDWCLKHRFMFIEHEAATLFGLFKLAEKKETDPLLEAMKRLNK